MEVISKHQVKHLVLLLCVITMVRSACVCPPVMSDSGAGSIVSPHHPCAYPNDCLCEWTLKTKPSTIIDVNITFDEIEECKDCACDSLMVYSNTSHQNESRNLEELFCGVRNKNVSLTIMNATDITLVFKTDHSITFGGFRLYYVTRNSQNCIHEHFSSGGQIATMNYGDDTYDDNSKCEWRISAPVGHAIRVYFHHFELETSGLNCPLDSVTVTDGNSSPPTILAKMCGNLLPFHAIYDKKDLLITFKSDENINGRGMLADYEFLNTTEVIHRSDALLLTSSSGTFWSLPFDARFSSQSAFSYDWLIQVEIGNIITLHWNFSSVESFPESYLVVYDGSSDLFKPIVCQRNSSTIVDSLAYTNSCTHWKSFDMSGHVTSSLFTMRIILNLQKEDSLVFYANYKTTAISHLSKENAVSMHLDQTWPQFISRIYRALTYCIFTFMADHNRNVMIEFRSINFTGNVTGSCIYGGLTLKDGDDDDVIGPFCSVSPVTRLGHVRSIRSFVSKINTLSLGIYCGMGCESLSLELIVYQTECVGDSDASMFRSISLH